MAPEIPDFDEFLGGLAKGLPAEPARRYELRAHPDVILALRMASVTPERLPRTSPPLYGSAAIVADVGLGSGGWELCETEELLKRGRLGEACNG
jgi:hypothetical protein